MKIPVLIVLALSAMPVLHAQVKEAVLGEIRAGLEEKLPDGWTVRIDAGEQWIEIGKEGKILQHPIPLPNAMGGSQPPPMPERFGIRLKVGEFVSVAEFKKRSAANRGIQKRLGAMYQSMSGISHKFDSFIPSNEAEREMVREYEELRESLHKLPQFFFKESASFVLECSPYLGGGIDGVTLLIADEGERKQVRKELAEAFSIFGSYESGEEDAEKK